MERGYEPIGYEFRLRGHLGGTILEAFPSFRAELCGQDTVLRGTLPDQAALHGVLSQIEGLGLELLEFRRVPLGDSRQQLQRETVTVPKKTTEPRNDR